MIIPQLQTSMKTENIFSFLFNIYVISRDNALCFQVNNRPKI